MRIIKGENFQLPDQMVTAIAGEMLNVEASRFYFLNGYPRGADDLSTGYPRILDGGVEYTIAATAGYIYFCNGVDLDAMIDALALRIRVLEPLIGDVLHNYQALEASHYTNLKVASATTLTVTPKNPTQKTNIKRKITTDSSSPGKARFTWVVAHIEDLHESVRSNDMSLAIAALGASIFCDTTGICKLAHNEQTFDLKITDFRGAERLLGRTLILSVHGSPLLVALSQYYSANVGTVGAMARVGCEVYDIGYAEIAMSIKKPPTCRSCSSLVHGDNYVLYGRIDGVEADACVIICPICVHNGASAWMINHYYKLCRVTVPLTTAAYIDDVIGAKDEVLADIYLDALKGVRSLGDFDSKYLEVVEVGDDHLAVSDVRKFILSGKGKADYAGGKYAEKKICNLRVCGAARFSKSGHSVYI